MIERAAAAAALALLAAGPAAAHGGLPGGAGFMEGLLHPLAATEHLILLVAVGFLSGQTPRERRGPGFLAVGIGLLAGLVLANEGLVSMPSGVAVGVLVLAMATGALVALARPHLPVAVTAGIAVVAGLTIGLDTGGVGSSAPEGSATVEPIVGVVIGVYLIVLDAAALSAIAIRPPFPVAIRALGSWIVAISAMLLALSLAPAA